MLNSTLFVRLVSNIMGCIHNYFITLIVGIEDSNNMLVDTTHTVGSSHDLTSLDLRSI